MAIDFIVASPDEAFRAEVRRRIEGAGHGRVAAEYHELGASLYIRVLQDVERHPEAALIFDLAPDPDAGLKSMEKVKQASPELYTIASNYEVDGEHILLAVRAGANDFLTQPFDTLEFQQVMERLERAPRRAITGGSRLGKVYTFLGAKGGVGTTALAVNTAALLALRKKQVVMVDLDWAANDVVMQLNAASQHSLLEIGENVGRLDLSLFEGFVTRDRAGFYIASPPDSLEQAGFFTEHMLRDLLTFLVEHYEAVVIDGGGRPDEDVVLGAIESSTNTFLVVNQRIRESIAGAERHLAYLAGAGVDTGRLQVVVNEYSRQPVEGVVNYDEIQRRLSVFYGLPSSPVVQAGINRGRPFIEDKQTSGELGRAFKGFVDKITGGKAPLAKSA
ncbi:MAG: hypothetical protein FJW40_00785 [Acidobacteria bacterium]|nr:hypothetical protein [Acidobacteriota bacterium]